MCKRGVVSYFKVKIKVKLQNLVLLKLQMNSIHQWLMFPDLHDKEILHTNIIIHIFFRMPRDIKNKYKELTATEANYTESESVGTLKPIELQR